MISSPQDGVAALRCRLQTRRAEAVEAYRRHLRPEPLLTALRRIADEQVRELLKIHPVPRGACVAAVGGYGRGELYPGSDLDILILLEHSPDADDRDRIETLIAALWDAGLEPGHSVRTVSQCRHEAAADITVQTALLEARWLAGSRGLFQQFRDQMQADLDPREFYLAKRTEMQQRHVRHQDTPYALEPNCKEAPGGLRDLQVLLWLARAAGLGASWKEVARTDLLTPAEFRSLRRAERAFKRLRIELHLLAGRREDRVLFDLQPRLAHIYGFTDQPHRRASELLMQRYYWAARVVCQVNRLLMQSLEEHLFPQPQTRTVNLDDDFCVRRDHLALRRPDAFERNPALLLRVFLVMQQHPELQGMAAGTLRAIWHARRRIDPQFRDNPVNRRQFLQILQQPRGIVHALRDMTMWNILPRYLPVFRRIVGQMQHDLFHAYTVDQHILMVIRNLRRFTMPEHAQEYPLASQLIADLDEHWLLYVAALFHDIAKGRGGDHSQLGAAEVRRFARQHQLPRDQADLLEFLVREHLTLSQVAQKRDLSDPRVIHEFATRVGTQRRLAALYLLTVADIRGTSPRVWNAWKGKLLDDLYHQTLAALGGARPDTGTILALRKDAAAAEIRRMGLRDESRDAFWSQLDVAYFLRHDANEIAWHTRHLYHCFQGPDPVVRARVLGQSEALQILAYAPDRADLFMDICSYFDRHGLSIQDARIHTTRQGWALDSFIVLLPDADRDYRSHASLIEHELRASLTAPPGSQPPPSAARRGSRRSRVFPIMPSITLQADEQGGTWRLSVTSADRVGLLRDLARVFTRHGVNLKMAKIMTLGDRVEDIFILQGAILEQTRGQLQFERHVFDALTVETDRAPIPGLDPATPLTDPS
ncbi:[protein-PII] uridylyltransferase [uncultured Castellaniella sp.]|uniref:[protein-PII] uridylyltransferase n=1 Tax=uncultured Castellaniella sp. TaxID=647907 RepID=UPI002602C35F|nr:[protein-PII] uridylyltransferase [uncultured Castellaniella sp.]